MEALGVTRDLEANTPQNTVKDPNNYSTGADGGKDLVGAEFAA